MQMRYFQTEVKGRYLTVLLRCFYDVLSRLTLFGSWKWNILEIKGSRRVFVVYCLIKGKTVFDGVSWIK